MYLFGVIEGLSNDVNDPYHYPVIRVLVGVLSEQKGGKFKKLILSTVNS